MNALDPIVWSILLLAAGCGLVVLEVFFPSGGFLGVLSCAAFVAAIGMAFYYHGTMAGMTLLLFSSASSDSVMVFSSAPSDSVMNQMTSDSSVIESASDSSDSVMMILGALPGSRPG